MLYKPWGYKSQRRRPTLKVLDFMCFSRRKIAPRVRLQ